MPVALPIDAVLPDLLAALSSHGAAVLEAPPGTGKTTRVPIAVAGVVEAEVWVLEPRRVAARAAASRVAAELGEAVGGTVGHAMRFDRVVGPKTRVIYVTEALLTRRLDDFDGIGAVILDEFHERSIHTDVALAWTRRLRRERPGLKLVVMSATLDGEALARFLGCPRIRADGSLFPVEQRYAERKDERPVEVRVAAAVRAAEGDVLAFLPGIGEIERASLLLADLDVFPLHGEIDGAAQDRALRASPSRSKRVVLATNVAETSVTVEGIRTVVDAGLARQAAYDPWSGLPTLDLVPIARDSAIQRAGRAGRLSAGVCVRLYSRADFEARPAQTLPEIRRIDLAATALALGGREVEWFEPPPAGAWSAAVGLLHRIGAMDAAGRTAIGEAMAGLPLPPRLGRVLVEAASLGAAEEGAALVSVLGGRRRRAGGGAGGTEEVTDPVTLALDGGGDPRDRRLLLSRLGRVAPRSRSPEDALVPALLAGFPDRVGRRTGPRVKFADGGAAECVPGRDGFVLVTEVDRVGNRVRVRSLTPVPEGLLLNRAEVRTSMRWAGVRVECKEELAFGGLVLDSSPGGGDAAAIATLLHEHARPTLHRLVPDWEAGVGLLHRVRFLRARGIELPELDLDALGRQLCDGRRSFDDLGGASLVGLLHGLLPDVSLVDRLAPAHVRLPGRARVAVDYGADDPFVASRMQDFFGLQSGPSVADGHALVLHLLAPNQRPVQVTRDLAGFWTRHYPAIRRELCRKYPRHRWPEDPRAAWAEEAPRGR